MKREKWIDCIKVIACFLVVTLHTVRDGVSQGINNIGLILFDCGVFAIPLFFMVNGYLQLRKKEISYKYCLKKIIRIVIIVMIWNLLYQIGNFIVNGEFKSIIMQTLYNLLIQGGYFSHFWFLGALIIIDLFLPIINKIFNTKNYGMIMTAIFIIICVLVDILNIRINYLGHNNIRETVFQPFRIWTWFTYFCIGGCISRISNKNINKKILYAITSIFIIFTVTNIYLFIKKLYGDLLVEDCYDNILVIITSTLIFYSIKNINFKNTKSTEIIGFIGKLSGGVYIIHPLIIDLVRLFIKYTNNFANVFVLILTFVLSLIISYIVSKIPKVSKIIQF